MDIIVALNGSLERNLTFAPGDDNTINLVVYAVDGDDTPLTVTNPQLSTGGGGLFPIGQEFQVRCLGRTPYRLAVDIDGVTTTVAFGVIESSIGYEYFYNCCFCYNGCIFPPILPRVGFTIATANGFAGKSDDQIIPEVTLNTTVAGLIYGDANSLLPVTIGAGLEFKDGTLKSMTGSGTVTKVSVATTNGFSGTVATDTTTPVVTLTTTVSGLLKGSGGTMAAATNADLPAMSSTVGGAVPTPPNNTTTFLRGDGIFAVPPASGDVVGPASAVNNRVAFFDGTTGKLIKDSGLTLAGTNTGDQTNITGNSGTATKLQTARNIDGQAFDGTNNITVIAPGTVAATAKTTPVAADVFPLADSAASNVLKKVTWANIVATIQTALSTVFMAFVSPGASGNVLTSTGAAWVSSPSGTNVGNHNVKVTTGNGYGSTNTKIRRYTTTESNVGTAITYADSATLGASFTINEDGLYAVGIWDGGAADYIGVSANSAQLTTNVITINAANRVLIGAATTSLTGIASTVLRLSAGDVIRPHDNGTMTSTTVYTTGFTIRKVAL